MVKHRADEEEEVEEEEEEDYQEDDVEEEDDDEEEDYGPSKKKKGKPAPKKEEAKAPRQQKKKGKEEVKDEEAPAEEPKAPAKRGRAKAAEAEAPTAPAKKKEPAAKPPPKEKRVTKRECNKHKEETILKQYEEVEAQAKTFEDVQAFVNENLGNEGAINSYKNLLKKTTGTRELTRRVISLLFLKAKDNPSHIQWAEEMVLATQTALMDPHKIIHEPMFFPSTESEAKVVHFLSMATVSLEVCVFSITYNVLGDALIEASSRKVNLRVISDDEMAKTPGSDVERMHKLGIPVKIDLDPKAHMHNKFAIIDKKILLTGSFNWTKQAALKNNENFLATNDEYLIEKYSEEFERLWEKFIAPGERPPVTEQPKAAEEPVKPHDAPQKPAETEADNMLSG